MKNFTKRTNTTVFAWHVYNRIQYWKKLGRHFFCPLCACNFKSTFIFRRNQRRAMTKTIWRVDYDLIDFRKTLTHSRSLRSLRNSRVISVNFFAYSMTTSTSFMAIPLLIDIVTFSTIMHSNQKLKAQHEKSVYFCGLFPVSKVS